MDTVLRASPPPSSRQPRGRDRSRAGAALRIVAAVAVVFALAYFGLFRLWQHSWDATPVEQALVLPGDSLVTEPIHVTTRAITIHAAPELVWPWLVQMGYRRGGLYSYDFLDRWFGVLDRPSADSLLPQFQGLKVGDTIPIGSGPGWPIALLVPNRVLLFHIRQGDVHVTWLFSLAPQDASKTRLITRVRASARLTAARRAQLILLDPLEFLMVRRMLLGLERRAERLADAPAGTGEEKP